MSIPISNATPTHLKFFPHTRPLSFCADLTSQYCDERTQHRLAAVNRSWYHAIQHHIFAPRLSSEGRIPGQRDHYKLKRTITQLEAIELFNQTGIEIPFAPGEMTRDHVILGGGRNRENVNGGVVIGYALKTAHYVAVKIIQKRDAMERQLQMQRALRTIPHLIPAIDSCHAFDSGQLTYYEMQPLAGLGAVDKITPLLLELSDPLFKEQLLYVIAEGLLTGLSGMHQMGIYHLDVKPENIVVTKEGTVSLIDVDCATKSQTKTINVKDAEGDEDFFPPERWWQLHDTANGLCDGTKIDAWAAGLILLSVSGIDCTPFKMAQMEAVLVSVTSRRGSVEEARLAFNAYVSHALEQIPKLKAPAADSPFALIRGLLECDSAKRLDAAQALDHPWIMKMRSSTGWHEIAKKRLCEFVQSLRREQRIAPVAPKAAATSNFVQLSPQQLPHPHFTNYIERSELQTAALTQIASATYEHSSSIVLQGMGGSGKTQLATYLIHHPDVQSRFGLKLWLRGADHISLLETQLLILARELRLIEGRTSFEVAIKILHQYFVDYPARFGKPWLVVFDNADTLTSLAPYLPVSGGQIIVTTRSPLWENPIHVDIMTPTEGVALVNHLLQHADPACEELCRTLGFLPLGIAQAVAYIRNQRITISAYLKQFDANSDLIVNDERLFGMKLPSSLLNLWEITFNTLSRSYPEALELLHTFSYLSPDGISTGAIIDIPRIAESILHDYGLLHRPHNTIHRLLQVAVRYHQRAHAESACSRAMNLLMSSVHEFNPSLQDLASKRPHVEILITHFRKLPSSEATTLRTFVHILQWLGAFNYSWAEEPAKAVPLHEEALAIIKKMDNPKPNDLVFSLYNLGNIYTSLNEYQKAILYYEEGLSLVPNDVATLGSLGITYVDLGEYSKAIITCEKALKYANEDTQNEETLRDIAHVRSKLGHVYMTLKDFPESITQYEKAIMLFKKAHEVSLKRASETRVEEVPKLETSFSHRGLALAFESLGVVYTKLGNHSKAIEFAKRSLEMYRKIYGPKHLYVAMILDKLGSFHFALKEYLEAAKYWEEASSILKKADNPNHIEIGRVLNWLGVVYDKLQNPLKAIEYYEQALAIYQANSVQSSLSRIFYNLGNAHYDLKNYPKAIECYEKALKINKEVENPDDSITANILFNLGLIYKNLKKYPQAIQYFKDFLEINRKMGVIHSDVADIYYQLGSIYEKLEVYLKAAKCYADALAMYKKVCNHDHPPMAAARNNAIECLEKALDIFNKADDHLLLDFAPIPILITLGETYHQLGEIPNAINCYKQALVVLKKAPGPEHPEVKSIQEILDNLEHLSLG